MPFANFLQADLALNWTAAVVAVTAFIVTQLTTVMILVKVFREQMQELTRAVSGLREEVNELASETKIADYRLTALEQRRG